MYHVWYYVKHTPKKTCHNFTDIDRFQHYYLNSLLLFSDLVLQSLSLTKKTFYSIKQKNWFFI